MGLECPVIIFIACLCLIGQISGSRGGNHKGPEKGANRCQGWENDLRKNLSAPGNITDYLNGLHESIPNLSPGCVQSFSRYVNHSTLMMLMEFLNMEYDNLKPGTRKQVYKWVEAIYMKVSVPNEMNGRNPKTNEKPTHMPNSNNGQAKGKGKGKGNWLTLDVLNILGRFIVQAPTSTLKSIASSKNSTICQLFNTSSDLLDKLHDLTPVQARIFFEGLQKCVNVDIMNETVIANLGQLACFYPVRQLKSLGMRARKALQGKLLNCTRNLREIYQMLVKKINTTSLTAKELKYLGASAIGLKVSQVSNLSDEAVAGALEELKKVKGWSKGQIKALVKKYQKVETVTADKLKHLGFLVSGLGAKTFDKFKGQELLDVFSQKDVAESPNAMLPVQKKSIMKAILQSVKIDSVLESLPESLVPQIPVDKLKNADNVINLDFLSKNKPWNLGQSVTLINRIKDQLNNTKNISKLKAVVKGIPCNLINSLKPDVVKALANNPLVSSDQIRCFSSKFFENQMARRPNYFSNLTLEDINEFLVSYMIFQPNIKELKLIPRSLCSNMVELISQINITMLPRSSPRRKQLLDYATDCLSLTASSLTEDQSNSLGSLVCAFSAEDMKSLNTTVFPAIVDQLRECGRFDKEKKSILREKILSAYPPLANWTVDELIQLHGLLAVLQLDDFKLIPNNEDIKAALKEILASRKSAENFIPPDFDNSPNFSSLYWKLFDILNKKSDVSRRRRATGQTKCPTSEEIEALGEANNLWSADQLKCISAEDFIDSLDTLTEVTGFNSDQLKALTLKASQAFGMNFTNDQLASLKKITLGFTDDGVKKYFTKPDIDTIGAISDYKEWSSDEYSSQAQTIVQNFLNGRDDSTLSSTDLVGMGYFLCTRRSDQIKKINATAYSSAAKDIGNKMCPKTETLTALKEKAIEAFSNVRTWTGAQLQEIGIVAAGLSAEEVSKLNKSAVSFLTPAAVSQFPSKVFSAMKIEQLRNLGPQNYGAVTEAQKRAMSKEQLDALNENAGYARVIGGAGCIYWNPVMMLTLLVLSLTAALH